MLLSLCCAVIVSVYTLNVAYRYGIKSSAP